MPDPLDFFASKRVVITGGAGSIGSELVRQLLNAPVKAVRVIDNNETSLFEIGERWRSDSRFEAYYCDVRDEVEVARTFYGMDVCLHAAALKHVPFCEASPFSAVQTNVIGTQTVIRAALANRLSHVMLTSSDKAVNPINVMGTSKLMAERLFSAAEQLNTGQSRCIFSATRFGNVAGTRGSVIPLFLSQLRTGQALTLTDPGMTRFFMTLEEAVMLVLTATGLAKGAEIFVTKMPVLRIADLAAVMVEELAPLFGRKPSDVQIKTVGARPGEKMWEELTNDEESRRIFDLGSFFVVVPAMREAAPAPGQPLGYIYNSRNETPMSRDQIKSLLHKPGVLPAEIHAMLSARR